MAEWPTVVLGSRIPSPRRSSPRRISAPVDIPSPRRSAEPVQIPAPRIPEQDLLPVGCAAPAGPDRPVPYRWRPDIPGARRLTAQFTRPFGVRVAAALIVLAVLGSVPAAGGRVIEDRGVPDRTPTAPRASLPPARSLPGALDAAGVPFAVPVPVEFTDSLPDGRAGVAVQAAMAQLGLPYQWGGDGPTAGDAGFDCSGLTAFAYAAAGIRLPRTAHTQFGAGPHVPAGSPLQPGDLLFYGTPDYVHHVGIYLGDGRMVNAPTFGQPVRTAWYRWRGDDYLGATRPAASGPRTAGELPFSPKPVPAPAAQPRQRVFEAPPAPRPAGPVPAPSADLPPEPQTAAAAIAAAGPVVSGDRDATGGAAVVRPSGMTVTGAPSASPAASAPAPARPTGSGRPTAAGTATTEPASGQRAGGGVTTPTTLPRPTTPAAPDPASAPAAPSGTDPTGVGPALSTTPAPSTTPALSSTSRPAAPAIPAEPRHVRLTRPSEFPLTPGPGAPRTVFDLDSAEPVAEIEPGDVVDAEYPDGSTRPFTVRTLDVLSAETAETVLRSSAEPLVVRAPLPDGTFLVLTGVPAAP